MNKSTRIALGLSFILNVGMLCALGLFAHQNAQKTNEITSLSQELSKAGSEMSYLMNMREMEMASADERGLEGSFER